MRVWSVVEHFTPKVRLKEAEAWEGRCEARVETEEWELPATGEKLWDRCQEEPSDMSGLGPLQTSEFVDITTSPRRTISMWLLK